MSGYFDPIIVSEEVDTKKPERAIFERLLNAWRVEPHAIMAARSTSPG